MKTCAICEREFPLDSFLNPQSGNERDHCRECWKLKTRAAAKERRDQAKLRREAIKEPTPPTIPARCPRCGGTTYWHDEDKDLVCTNCNELLVSYSNYRRELREYQRIKNTRIRGLGRPRKGEVLVSTARTGGQSRLLRTHLTLDGGAVYRPRPVSTASLREVCGYILAPSSSPLSLTTALTGRR